ncbi:hypothetical protein GCM10008905_25510 [Clostridium malenominatum]|uniref:Uncharacterized protein n=1 Tax=Clostridium malenominatum TaxID=1539 RepID=A0ABN1J3H6_9CLOT
MRKNYKMKKTISMKRFLSEFGQDFSDNVKNRLLDLEIRSVLTRDDNSNILDIKHVEHTKYPCPSTLEGATKKSEKEYAYGQLVVVDGSLYFTDKCFENEEVMQSPIVDSIYNSLNSEDTLLEGDITGKKVDDSNIDYIIDTLLKACPQVSKEYMEIMKDILFGEEIKSPHKSIS